MITRSIVNINGVQIPPYAPIVDSYQPLTIPGRYRLQSLFTGAHTASNSLALALINNGWVRDYTVLSFIGTVECMVIRYSINMGSM